jgi:hypothetical protein
MKKKIRSIIVDSKKFAWRVVPDEDYPENEVWLRLWRNGSKQRWASVRCRFNNPWFFYGELLTAPEKASEVLQLKPLTPKQVAHIIRQLPDSGGFFSLTGSGEVKSHAKTNSEVEK